VSRDTIVCAGAGRQVRATEIASYDATLRSERPWNNWPWVDYQHALVTNLAAGQAFTATLSFPESAELKFEPGTVYLLNIYLTKKQNDIQFPDGAWQWSPNKWRLGGFATQFLITP
jgi:hypothetical protein